MLLNSPMQPGETRDIASGAITLSITRRSADYLVVVDNDRSNWHAAKNLAEAVGLAVLAHAQLLPVSYYQWVVRWHLPGEVDCARTSRFSGIATGTPPSLVWRMVVAAHPDALPDEVVNVTLSGETT